VEPQRKVVLIVADGLGEAPKGPGNFASQAKTPFLNKIKRTYAHCSNKASGSAVGLPKGAQGNSEVGHLHMGAGRIVWQLYERINKAIEDKSFFKNDKLLAAMRHAKDSKSTLHLMGLCSDEGVHAHIDHLKALMLMAKDEGVEKVRIHFIADGRDVAERSAQKYIKEIEDAGGEIATVVGRYYAMDRDKNWERTKKAFNMLTGSIGAKASSAKQAVEIGYKNGAKTDYYLPPTVIYNQNGSPKGQLADNDAMIFFNFRTDRPRQLTHALLDEDFDKFERPVWPDVNIVTMTAYDNGMESMAAFQEEVINNNLGQVLATLNLKQLRIAETEKYAHVTYFFNSQREEPNEGEDRIMVPSLKVPSYDEAPKMSAAKIVVEAITKIEEQKYDFILINFANCDLVGHTAQKEAIIKAVETVDKTVAEVTKTALANDYVVVYTSDHGNAEDKLYDDGTPKPSHSTNPVGFYIISNDELLAKNKIKLKNGGQQDVAPTILDIMGLSRPPEMTGDSLITYN